MTRRSILTAAAAIPMAAKAITAKEWQPSLGILGQYTPANVQFAHDDGFTNMILEGGPRSTLDAEKITDEQIARVKSDLSQHGIGVSALMVTVNHIAADSNERERNITYFKKAIEMAGKLGVRNIGAMSGKNAAKPFQQQVDDIVRTYTENYFPLCEKHNVRIAWEPWPEGPNLATGPLGYDALFHGFNDSPWVGLQFDPSHGVRQFMDSMQIARDYVKYIYDVHLKDTEIMWHKLKRTGINPVDGKSSWWRYRLPGLGSIDWAAFFTVLQDARYAGGMSIEHEDPLYGCCSGPDYSEEYKMGFRMAHKYLRQYVPEKA